MRSNCDPKSRPFTAPAGVRHRGEDSRLGLRGASRRIHLFGSRGRRGVSAAWRLPARYIILCPNHTGRGEPLAIMSAGAWRTPLGDVPIDEELAADLKARFPLLTEDEAAHRFEHALEVQLPFLQVLRPEFASSHHSRDWPLRSAERTGSRHRAAIRGSRRAGTGHCLQRHEPLRERCRDTREGPARHRPDPGARSARALRSGARSNISMCGYGPTVAMLTAALKLGATKAELLRYATSGDVREIATWWSATPESPFTRQSWLAQKWNTASLQRCMQVPPLGRLQRWALKHASESEAKQHAQVRSAIP